MKLSSKIALSFEISSKFRWFYIDFIFLCGAFWIFLWFSFKNRIPAWDVLEISSIYLLKREILGRSFWYRIDIGFVGFFIRILIVSGMVSISVLYQIDSFKIVLFWSKSRSRTEILENFEKNRAPLRSVLEIRKKIVLSCGVLWILERKSRSRAEYSGY